VGILCLDFHFSMRLVVGAAGMRESRQRFPRARGRPWETCFWFSTPSTDPHFRSPPRFRDCSCNPPLVEAGKQLAFSLAHLRGGSCVAVGARQLSNCSIVISSFNHPHTQGNCRRTSHGVAFLAVQFLRRVPSRDRSRFVSEALAARLEERDLALARACDIANQDPDVAEIEHDFDALRDELAEPWK
jgi:hypothetical protein